jgi:hypothetical protein
VSVYIAAWAIVGTALARMLTIAVTQLRAALASGQAEPFHVSMSIFDVMLASNSQGKSAVIVSIANPGTLPVLVGLTVRRQRCPGWLGLRHRTRVARRTVARRYRADRHRIIGIVPANAASVLAVPFSANRGRQRVVAIIGQSDHRLRVISTTIAWLA